MSQVRNNLKSIRAFVEDLNQAARTERNAQVRPYFDAYPKDAQEDTLFMHGRRMYRDKTLDTFFDLINRQPIWWSIRFITNPDDKALLASAANDIFSMVRGRAPVDSGWYYENLKMYIKEVNRPARVWTTSSISEASLPNDRPIVGIVAETAYASTLEDRGVMGGIMYYVAQRAKAKYSGKLNIKYNYISGKRWGLRGGTFPQIVIGAPGNVRVRLTRPGKKRRKAAKNQT